MSTRRVPLSANPNVVNSPLRGTAAALAALAATKQKRSHASAQREEAYGQPPPAKRQMVEPGVKARMRSPTKPRPVSQRLVSRAYTTERASQQATAHKPSQKEVEEVHKWQQSQRSRFPKLVFFFDNVPQDVQARLTKQVVSLGAVSRPERPQVFVSHH